MDYMKEYQKWLTSGVLTPNQIAELEAIKDDPKEIESRRGGRNVLEGCCRRDAKRLLKLLYKLPRVERVKKVDISGTAVENLYRKIRSVLHKNT